MEEADDEAELTESPVLDRMGFVRSLRERKSVVSESVPCVQCVRIQRERRVSESKTTYYAARSGNIWHS